MYISNNPIVIDKLTTFAEGKPVKVGVVVFSLVVCKYTDFLKVFIHIFII